MLQFNTTLGVIWYFPWFHLHQYDNHTPEQRIKNKTRTTATLNHSGYTRTRDQLARNVNSSVPDPHPNPRDLERFSLECRKTKTN